MVPSCGGGLEKDQSAPPPGLAELRVHPIPSQACWALVRTKKGQIKVCEWLQRAAQWLQGREPPPTADHDLPAPKMRLPRIRVDPKADDKCP